MPTTSTDIVILGAGHNGLACAFYLARAGHKVMVLERRGVVGGAAVTEEFWPGFRNSTASYTVSLLRPEIIRDMALARHGLRIVERRLANFLPLPDGRYLAAGAGRTAQEVAKFSARDAERLPAYEARLETIAALLREFVLQAPPNLLAGAGWRAALPQWREGLKLGRRLSGLDLAGRRDLLDLFAKSAGDWLDGWFETEPIKALFGFDSVVGNYASPYTPGSAYVLLHHVFGEVNGRKGAWGHAIGGMGAITQAMARACAEHGVEIRLDSAVAEVLTERGWAVGAVTETGDVVRARAVISNLHPRLTMGKVDPALLPADFAERMGRYASGSATFRMNVALSELPRFTALPQPGDHLTAGIIIAPSLAYMDRAHAQARLNGVSDEPIVEMLIPSTLDDSLAPPGQHVASLFCQHVAPDIASRGDWPAQRERIADRMIATVDAYAPGFAASVLGRLSLGPADLEERFGLVGGDIFHGRLTLDQLFSARPVLGHADYRMPVPGLYLCGSGAHPGGGVTGAPGHNAARAVLADWGKNRR